jgi:PAS domain-containing protein
MLRKELLENCDLHTILDLPSGVFTGAGVKTVVLFFEKGRPTEKIWYYQPDFGRNLGKTNPLSEDDLAEFVKLQAKKTDSEKSWTIKVKDLNPETYDLSVKNPNKKNEEELRKNAEAMRRGQIELQEANKKLEAQIREVERGQKRQYALLENASEVISIYDENMLVTYESPSSKSILGYEPDYIVGKSAIEKFDDNSRHKFHDVFK